MNIEELFEELPKKYQKNNNCF